MGQHTLFQTRSSSGFCFFGVQNMGADFLNINAVLRFVL
jgi:hypothetical protein